MNKQKATTCTCSSPNCEHKSHSHEHSHSHGNCSCSSSTQSCSCTQNSADCDCAQQAESSTQAESSCTCEDTPCPPEDEHHHSNDGCGCGCSHSHTMPESHELRNNIIKLSISIVLVFVAGAVAKQSFSGSFIVSLLIYIIAYFTVGSNVVLSAFKGIAKGNVFNENFLMSVATIGAFAIGDYAEAVAVMIFYHIGETLQDMAVAKSRSNIANLMNIRPEFARIVEGEVESEVAPETVNIGALISIRPGERIPLDCVVVEGESAVDMAALTGESVPVSATSGTELSSGGINLSGVLTCQVTNIFANSTVQKILDLVNEASAKKASAEKFITRFAKIYTPIVMALALLIAVVPPMFFGFSTFSTWFYRGLIFLVVSCPCALVVSIPVSFLGGIGGAAKNGVLVKGGDVIDKLANAKVVIFDKTGTLTKGKFAVEKVLPSENVATEELLNAAALCEENSNHPIALSVKKYCNSGNAKTSFSSYEERAGYGILAAANGHEYAVGNLKLMNEIGLLEKASAHTSNANETVLHVAKNKEYLGSLVIADSIKQGTSEAIKALRELGVEKCYMLTGDNENVAKVVANQVGLDGYKAGLLPNEKVAAFEELTSSVNGISIYTGDGINDAPLLSRADIGFAMGGIGSDAAIEAADVVLMTDEVGKIGSAIKVARRTQGIVKQNIIFALGVKAIIMVIAALGFTPMWLAIFGDVGVALIAIANATRAIRPE